MANKIPVNIYSLVLMKRINIEKSMSSFLPMACSSLTQNNNVVGNKKSKKYSGSEA